MRVYWDNEINDYIIDAGTPEWIVTKVEPRRDYTLLLTFISGEQKIYDARPLLKKPLFKQLNNIDFFKKAKVRGDTVAWSDDVDIAPEHLYECSVPLTNLNS